MAGEASMDVMGATRRARCRHGYTDLTMQEVLADIVRDGIETSLARQLGWTGEGEP